MQISDPRYDYSGAPQARHVRQALSISDDNHHVTEAIGDMYGDNDYGRDSRPLSFISSSLNDTIDTPHGRFNPNRSSPSSSRPPVAHNMSNERVSPPAPGQMLSKRNSSFGPENGALVSPIERSPSDPTSPAFEIPDIDYQSSPADVAKELSNLQALRRMSMDVTAGADPDLPTFNGSMDVPSVAPSASSDEDDTSRLFWVPARLHPELAPKEFKTFFEERLDQIQRRSRGNSLSPQGTLRDGSSGSLRRKKSMLSKQIDNSGGSGAEDYHDGADILENKRAAPTRRNPDMGGLDLQKLGTFADDPSQLVRKLSLDTGRSINNSEPEVSAEEDMPILPAAPPGAALRRSTRTTYRRGSLRRGERVPPSKRAARVLESESDDTPTSPPSTIDEISPQGHRLARSWTEPSQPTSDEPTYEYTSPTRSPRDNRMASDTHGALSMDDISLQAPTRKPLNTTNRQYQQPLPAAETQRGVHPSVAESIPEIIEIPPAEEQDQPQRVIPIDHPERVSSHEPPPSVPPKAPLPHRPPPAGPPPASRLPKRPALVRHAQNSRPEGQTLNDMANNPSPLPGNSTRTDSLSFIPTLTEEKRPDKKQKDKKDRELNESGRKSSWGWLRSSEDREKKEKEREEKEFSLKKPKLKSAKAGEKPHDSARLDVLQSSIEGVRGRESLVLDRESIWLEEERKKESGRRSGGDHKKEKEPSLFSSFFGGKKKGDRDSGGRKASSVRGLSPEPPPRILKPDVDYHWTRFSILEERAIYRMAHMKLANPRRPLYSQVLLSNFMYSYLAKVQQMHPHIQVPQSAAQQRQQRVQQQQQHQNQPEEFSAYQRYQEQQERQDRQLREQDGHHHQPYQQQGLDGGANYVDDSEIYSHDHGQQDDQGGQISHGPDHGLVEGGDYSHYQDHYSRHSGINDRHYGDGQQFHYDESMFDDGDRKGDDDMW